MFEKMCGLSSFELFTIADQVGAVDQIYDEDQCLDLEYNHVILHEEYFIEEVFVHEQKVENNVWLDAMVKRANWVFSGPGMRR